MSKPKVLILGGIGFIGRNLVKFLVDAKLCSFIRVADKVLPQTAFLGKAHEDALNAKEVEFKQSNLNSAASIAKAFTVEGGFDYVFNLACETKYGQTPEVYKEKVLDVAVKCLAEAKKQKVKKWIEVSTAQVYAAGKKASDEKAKVKPWTRLAEYKLMAEDAVRKSGVDFVIIRPVTVYGPGDSAGLAPRLIVGAVYKHLKETQKNLWSGDLRMHTVHVTDVCTALWHAAVKLPSGSTWNLADKNDTTQGTINKHLESIFGIDTKCMGTLLSGAVKSSLSDITEDANDKHLKPWSDLCRAAGIVNTPLTPYIDQELLFNNSLCVDGAAIEGTGFKYSHPTLSDADFKEIMQYYIDQKLFPAGLSK